MGFSSAMASGGYFRSPPNSMGIQDLTIGIPSTNGPIEIRALRRRVEQRLIDRCRDTEVMVDSPTTELQLQKFPGFVVANRRKRG
jgi:hypothetical protein